MEQYTTPEQTAKLIELGFEKPKGWCNEGISNRLIMAKHKADDEGFNYSIGELIEMLNNQEKLTLVKLEHKWYVNYHAKDVELIDALYEMVVKLKEEGVI